TSRSPSPLPEGAAREPPPAGGRPHRHPGPRRGPARVGPEGPAGARDPLHARARAAPGLHRRARRRRPGRHARGDAAPGRRARPGPAPLPSTGAHTAVVNGRGWVGWGVGGIEAEAAMLGQPTVMLIPQVVGFRLHGQLAAGATATDVVLTVTQMLRKRGVVGM